ncbi:glycosyltransferase family 8 C-terminal domain-containing protein [Escherichia coli]|nr:glycosyltransferase family 8 C-terminal domain-containing protein [Escherichia coli]
MQLKPWHKWAIYPSVKYYKIALENSPERCDSPRDAKSIIEFKKI